MDVRHIPWESNLAGQIQESFPLACQRDNSFESKSISDSLAMLEVLRPTQNSTPN